ncbi:glycosyltransferase 87 family protein [Phytohabitans aurantiacus]|jgi:alpha-1,2-mannosyltransferase|uniref:glycosyltransferase 87 family protein n=1 Tax=Phytohabitans aurantiacus TaxID=3016789 RepID=UPI00248FE1D5|nr:glycosyltransferase 87 family protein [Phytohabitans aurantiacus]
MPATVEGRMDRLATVRRVTRGIDRWTVVRIGIVAGVFYAAWLAIEAFGRPYEFFDMKIYHGAVVWWASGNELYEFIQPDTTLGFTYPPFAGLAMLPMATLPVAAAGWINVFASIAALAIVLTALVGPIAKRCGWPRWFAVGLAVPLAAATEPVRETFGYGQVNLLLFALIMADMVALRWLARGRANHNLVGRGPLARFFFSGAWAGAGIGLATSIKLTPALFIVYLLLTRQWRVALTAVGTAFGVTVATFVVAGHESMRYFTSVLWQTDRVGAADMTPNQSLAGVLARLYDSVETPGLLWLSFSLLMLAVGLTRAAHAHADGDELTAFTLVGLTANVISPISWSHHLVFVIPAVLVLADAALRRRGASQALSGVSGLRTPIWFPALTGLRHGVAAIGLYILFVVSPIWPYEHRLPEVSHYADGLYGALMENSLALAIILLVAALPWRPGAEPAFYADSPALHLTRRVRGS